jgi:S-adenosylmethionine/arginine decarboxylase-like enzyme
VKQGSGVESLPTSTAQWRRASRDTDTPRADVLDDLPILEAILSEELALDPDGGGVVWTRHRFEPQGVSLFAQGPHVRVALHTWPERRVATLDVWSDRVALDLEVERIVRRMTIPRSDR